MCGIHVTVSRHGHSEPDPHTLDRLRRRGPDAVHTLHLTVNVPVEEPEHNTRSHVYVTITGTVLSLRGDHVTPQPLSSGGCALCFNGEAWTFAGSQIKENDAQVVFRALCHIASASVSASAERAIAKVPCAFAGPCAFAFLDGWHQRLYFGRDLLGRRSLLRRVAPNGDLELCSIPVLGEQDWVEVDADGLYWIDLASSSRHTIHSTPYHSEPNGLGELQLNNQLPTVSDRVPALTESSTSVTELERHLRRALKLRLDAIPCPPTIHDKSQDARVAVLFSGGLDCTVLARLAHDNLDPCLSIDLLNVAFENPRVHGPRTPTSQSPYELCPDRETGRRSFNHLQKSCPGRKWRFVTIDVPYSETLEHRETITSLIFPHNTEMDLSIAQALYFAARGAGQTDAAPYTSPARVLLSGLGADELFGGYSRHAIAYNRTGLKGLVDQLQLDVARLGKRNLGRDDRVISHWAKEARYPFLDETLVSWALAAPVWLKCGFGHSSTAESLEPGKLVLRCLASRLGMHEVAREKKRAIQFGARTAKMETGRSRGTQVLASTA